MERKFRINIPLISLIYADIFLCVSLRFLRSLREKKRYPADLADSRRHLSQRKSAFFAFSAGEKKYPADLADSRRHFSLRKSAFSAGEKTTIHSLSDKSNG